VGSIHARSSPRGGMDELPPRTRTSALAHELQLLCHRRSRCVTVRRRRTGG
jgi:hypothetical protein